MRKRSKSRNHRGMRNLCMACTTGREKKWLKVQAVQRCLCDNSAHNGRVQDATRQGVHNQVAGTVYRSICVGYGLHRLTNR